MDKNRSKKQKMCPTCKVLFYPWASHGDKQKYCKKTCSRRSDEFKLKVSKKMTGRIAGHRGKKLPNRQGANCHFWRGGVSKINRTERQNFSRTMEYKNFRESVLKRDGYKCIECGDHSYKGRGSHCKLFVDHIKPYSLFPELRLDINNARTLCNSCNKKTDTYGTRVFQYTRKDFE